MAGARIYYWTEAKIAFKRYPSVVIGHWHYFGTQKVQTKNPRITIPQYLLNDYPGLSEQESLLWFREKIDQNIIDTWEIAGRHEEISDPIVVSPEYPKNEKSYKMLKSEQDFMGSLSQTSKNTTTVNIPKAYQEKAKSEIPLESKLGPEDYVHFISNKELLQSSPKIFYLLKTTQLEGVILTPVMWDRSIKNKQRLYDLVGIEEVSDRILPWELRTQPYHTQYTYEPPHKGGSVVIKRERVDEIGARWFKPRGGGNNHAPTYYFVIECVFEIVEDNREPSESSEDDNLVQNERKLRQKGKTRQFETTSIRPNAFGEWEVRREEGELNHIPRAIKTALLHYGWQIEE